MGFVQFESRPKNWPEIHVIIEGNRNLFLTEHWASSQFCVERWSACSCYWYGHAMRRNRTERPKKIRAANCLWVCFFALSRLYYELIRLCTYSVQPFSSSNLDIVSAATEVTDIDNWLNLRQAYSGPWRSVRRCSNRSAAQSLDLIKLPRKSGGSLLSNTMMSAYIQQFDHYRLPPNFGSSTQKMYQLV